MEKITNDVILRFVEISSATKDSLVVTWNLRKDPQRNVSGYRIGYQALGSSVVQFTQRLRPAVNQYDITNLHENTVYNVCVEVLTNGSLPEVEKDPLFRWGTLCATGATNTESLTVALGSTVGAFLALAVIVFFVLVAKWQHQRRKGKLHSIEQRFITSCDFSFDEEQRCDYEQEAEMAGCHPTGSEHCVEGRYPFVSGSPTILVYADDLARSQLEDAGGGGSSSSSKFLDCSDPTSVFVAELEDGQGYGLLVPLERAPELLPLIVEDSINAGRLLKTAEQSNRRRKRLQKYKTIDHDSEYFSTSGHERGELHGNRKYRNPDEEAEPWNPDGDLTLGEWIPELVLRDQSEAGHVHGADCPLGNGAVSHRDSCKLWWTNRSRSFSI